MINAQRLSDMHDKRLSSQGNSLTSVFNAAFDWYGGELQCCLPVVIKQYDRVTRLAQVQPLVKALTRQKGFASKQTFSVYMLQYAANGFVIDFPITDGDVGWVIASDRYTRNVKETHEECELEDLSTHRYSSGFFIPDYYGALKSKDRSENRTPYTNEDNRLVISTFDGTQKISIGENNIKIYSHNEGTIDEGTTTATIAGGTITITSSNGVIINANTTINGTLTVSGDITGQSEIKNKDGTKFSTHTHPTAALGSPSSPTIGS